MRHRTVLVGRALVAVIALALAACGSSTSGGTNSPSQGSGTVSTTSPSGGSSTTQCTIPQNNGGDHDADNNGGPDDGDGCDR